MSTTQEHSSNQTEAHTSAPPAQSRKGGMGQEQNNTPKSISGFLVSVSAFGFILVSLKMLGVFDFGSDMFSGEWPPFTNFLISNFEISISDASRLDPFNSIMGKVGVGLILLGATGIGIQLVTNRQR